ncbi:MAG: sel1 repeat family protein [Magnetococcus sp. YQC-5]
MLKFPQVKLMASDCIPPDGIHSIPWVTAVKWFRKAAEQGKASSQFNLGFMYDVGRGVAEDRGEVIKWYRKAAAQGDERAKHNLQFLSK